MRHQRLMLQGGLAGLVIGAMFASTWAVPYTSTAVLRLKASMLPEHLVPAQNQIVIDERVPSMVQTVMSRGNLMSLVTAHKLYPDERARMPLEDVVEKMRKAIRISSRPDSRLEVSFSYEDRALAQTVTAALVQRILMEFSRERSILAMMNLQFLKESAASAGTAWEESLQKVRSAEAAGKPLDRARLDAEIARQRYQKLSEKVSEAEMLDHLERRQQGQTLEILDPASLPSDSRHSVFVFTLAGGLAGVLIGWLVSMFFASRAREAVADAV